MKIFFSLLIVIFTFLGVLDAGYLTISELSGNVPPCQQPFACDTVLKSKWSHIGPVPLALVGLLFYASFFTAGAASVLEIRQIHLAKFTFFLPSLLLLLGSFGVIFSLYLVFVMGVLLKAWCLYCILSAINCGILFIISLSFWGSFGFPPLQIKDTDEKHI